MDGPTIIDGSGERYRTVGIDVRLLLQSVDHPERPPVWVGHDELGRLREAQPDLRKAFRIRDVNR